MSAATTIADEVWKRYATPRIVRWTTSPPAPPVELTLVIDPYDEEPMRIRIAGEMCTYSTMLMRPAISDALDEQPSTVVIDMSGVTFVDGRGLELLLEAQRCVEEGGGVLCIVDPSPCVARLLEISGHERSLVVAGSRHPGARR